MTNLPNGTTKVVKLNNSILTRTVINGKWIITKIVRA